MPLCPATSSVIRPRCPSLRPGSGFPEALAPKRPCGLSGSPAGGLLPKFRSVRPINPSPLRCENPSGPASIQCHRKVTDRLMNSATMSWWRRAWSISSSSSHRARRSDRHQLVSPGGVLSPIGDKTGPPPPPFDIETMEPIEPPWQAVKEWIPDDEPDLDWFNRPRDPSDPDPDGFDQSPAWQPEEIPLGDGRTLVLDVT
jgi:hypothetical protein